MSGYLLDTSIVIEYTKGNKRVVEMINNLEGEIVSSYVVLSELYEGIFRSKNEVEQRILGFFDSLDKVIGINKQISKIFGKVRSDLKERGEVIEDLDILVASTCMANDLSLITLNGKHFKRIEGLKVFTPDDFKN